MLGCRCGCPALTGHRIIPPKPGTINFLPREDKKPVEHYGRKVFYSFGQASWPGPGAQKQLSRTQASVPSLYSNFSLSFSCSSSSNAKVRSRSFTSWTPQ